MKKADQTMLEIWFLQKNIPEVTLLSEKFTTIVAIRYQRSKISKLVDMPNRAISAAVAYA